MCSEIQPNYGSWKHASVFTWQGRKQTVQGECFFLMNDCRIHWDMKIARDDSAAKLGCSDWCNFPLNASKDIRARSYFFTRRTADVVSEACFTVMNGDRHDERAAMDFSMIIFALTPSWLVWILTIMPVWLYFSSFLFCFVLFLNTEFYMLYEC